VIAEIGQYLLILTLVLAGVQATVPLWGVARGDAAMMRLADRTAIGQAVALLAAFAALTHGFVTSDFSLEVVFQNSHSLKPMLYKVSGVWGNHEGSMLLWVLVLSLFSAAVGLCGRNLPPTLKARVLAVQAMIGLAFLAFIIFTSNPFARLTPAPPNGAGLNPLLQDPGLAFHPPLLYLGYVGFSMAFSFAVAALIEGKVDAAWARWVRPWTLAAWSFLTAGIALGSWWAYYELGWGGWWFWDPVENASFMPWLFGTALLHSAIVVEKRDALKSWTILLAILTFSMSLLGTFLVRSGVLTSVHAFASDPERGIFILALLGICVGGSLLLYALKAPTVASVGRYEWVSRESFMLLNNLLLVVAAFAILLGTLYPLIIDFFGMGKISVGASWFNTMFVPLSVLLALIIGPGAMSRWKADELKRIGGQTVAAVIISLLLAFAVPLLHGGDMNWQVFLGIAVALWLITVTLTDVWKKCRGQLSRIPSLGLSFQGMVLAHIGVAITIIGVAMVANYSEEKAARMAPGDVETLGAYQFEFVQAGHIEGPNFVSDAARFRVTKDGREIAMLTPEKRRYNARGQIMTEAAIDVTLFRDVYISMGEPLDNGAWGMRLQVKPFMRWVWLGAIFMSLGGALAMADKRYRRRKTLQEATA